MNVENNKSIIDNTSIIDNYHPQTKLE